MEHAHVKGERVKIVGGMYKRYKTGTFVETYGRKMATVNIDGEKQRNIWLTSIAPIPASKKRPGNVVLSSQDYQELVQEIHMSVGALEHLQLKVKSFHK